MSSALASDDSSAAFSKMMTPGSILSAWRWISFPHAGRRSVVLSGRTIDVWERYAVDLGSSTAATFVQA
jgi:hypothetical protein